MKYSSTRVYALFSDREQVTGRFAGSADVAPTVSSGPVHMRAYSQSTTVVQLSQFARARARVKRANTHDIRARRLRAAVGEAACIETKVIK